MEKIILTDGGRIADGFTQEKRDCTVRALALARRISYRQAYEILAKAGRKPRHGFRFIPWIQCQPYAKDLGSCGSPTVRKFISEHEERNYIVRISGHVFALCGGIALDTFDISERRYKVLQVWEIEIVK